MRTLPTIILTALLPVTATAAELVVELPQPVSSNLFPAGSEVAFEATLRGGTTGDGTLVAVATDAWGKEAWRREIPLAKAGERLSVPVVLDPALRGYFELDLQAHIGDAKGTVGASFGVVPFVERSAEDHLAMGKRFGLKLWTMGDIWWNRKIDWDEAKSMRAAESLGLQWTRALLGQRDHMDTLELMTDFELNVITKIESFPESCYDSERYGPLEEVKKRKLRWNVATVPLKEPFQAWIREEVAKLPASQRIFEVWNEPWQWHKTMSAEDFASITNWAIEAVKSVRPDAIVGPNIYGHIQAYDIAMIKAGGLDHADMVAIHPYASDTPENKRFRQRLRNYHDLIEQMLGRRLDLYSTEYGWATAPKGERVVDELEQAQRTVRESLMLYAEGVKTLIPHTAGQREYDPAEREHYFGFFRLDHSPKPVIVAHAVSARMIDGSTYLGDLWLGPGIGAMVFERADGLVAALWTEEERKRVRLPVDAKRVTLTDLFGTEREVGVRDGNLELEVSDDVLYVSGLGRGALADLLPAGSPLCDERWNDDRKEEHAAARMTTPPSIDGSLEEWSAIPSQTVRDQKLPDIQLDWRMAWGDDHLYLAAQIKDKAQVNDNDLGRLDRADALVINLCARPERQVGNRELYDYELVIAPTSAEGRALARLSEVVDGAREVLAEKDPSGIRWAVSGETDWVVEVAIPFRALRGGDHLEGGAVMAYALWVFDRDRSDVDEWREFHKRVQTYKKEGRIMGWPLLRLEP